MDHLLTEARNPASAELDRLTPLELTRLMNAEDATVIPAVASQADAVARAIEVTADRIRAGGRLVYIGAGTSGRLGVLDAAECPPTFSSPPEMVVGIIAGGPTALTRAVEGAEDHPEQGERDLQAVELSAKDVVVGIATSGRTPYVQGGLAYARRVGAFAIGFACTPDSELVPHADLMIAPLVGPEVLTGSTRLKAGTATKLVLNTISTGVMVRLGKTYGNLMVDLRATNSKLRARTNRIVRHFTGLSGEEADALLSRCGGELKTALVAQRADLSAAEARARLASVGGQVRVALEPAGTAGPTAAAPDLVLGIDGGGSHTVALLASADGTVLGRGEAGPSNMQSLGAERALRALEAAVTAAFGAAGRPRCPVGAACLGLSGAGRPNDQAIIRDWAGRFRLADRVEVGGDAALLLAAGTPEDWGLAVVAGTGSIAYAKAPDGRTARSGGWGPLIGDEGSAYHLVMDALKAVVRAADGRRPGTLLSEAFLARLGLKRTEELVPLLHGGSWDRPALAALAPVVLDAWAARDAVADGVVELATRDLAATAVAAAAQLGLTAEPIPLALAGGLLLNSASYRRRFLDRLESLGVKPGAVALVTEPANGAVRLAAEAVRR